MFPKKTGTPQQLQSAKSNHAPANYYNLIPMDLMMPNMDGFEATRRIRNSKDREKAQIPIIAVTASTEEENRKKALDAGITSDFLKIYR